MKSMSLEKIKKALSFVAFMVILCLVFNKVTWVFRYNTVASRRNIVGYDNIEEGTLDVILYGSSDIYTYFSPMEAYRSYGFTSYDYATGGAVLNKLEVMKYYIEESRKTQNPKLYVVGIRPLTLVEDTEKAVRNWTDSIGIISPSRIKSLYKYYVGGEIPSLNELPSYVFDIAKYHTYFEGPKNPEHWQRTADSLEKGFYPRFLHTELETPKYETEEKRELSEKQAEVLGELLDYCSEEGLEVLFVLSPYMAEESEYECYNTVKEVVSLRGFRYLDLTDCIDFETDMSDINHVNYMGAAKYTAALGSYISENYDMPDHRNETGYEDWDRDYSEYAVLAEKYSAKVKDEPEK